MRYAAVIVCAHCLFAAASAGEPPVPGSAVQPIRVDANAVLISVSVADYESYLQSLQAEGNVSDQPLLGGITSQTQSGLAHPLGTPQGGSE